MCSKRCVIANDKTIRLYQMTTDTTQKPQNSTTLMQCVSFVHRCIKQSVIDLVHHEGVEHAGYIAFLIMLGIFPFTILLAMTIGFIGRLYFHADLNNIFQTILLESKWSELITSLKPRLIEIMQTPPQKFLTFAIVSAIWSASSIIEGLRTILNRAYHVQNPLPYIPGRMISIAQFVLMLASMSAVVIALNAAPLAIQYLNHYLPSIEIQHPLYVTVRKYLNDTALWRNSIMLSIALVFTLYLHYYLPDKKQKLLHLIPGLCVTILGWYICSVMLKYYITTFSQINFIYGSIAGIIISLFYFYICNLVFIFSAEFNHNCYTLRRPPANTHF